MLDIVFISYKEPNADANWLELRQRFPYARRLHGVTGIHRAHQLAAKSVSAPCPAAELDYFWVVDGDSIVLEDFDFLPPYHIMDQYRQDSILNVVYVYRAKNPVNDLSYGYGGIKLLPRQATAQMNTKSIDMTTNISPHFHPMDQVASVTKFNTDPFNTWKSAFRECVKLSGRVIHGQIDTETSIRLNTWCTNANGAEFGEYALAGAQAGKAYGLAHANDVVALGMINDFAWLLDYYEQQTFN